MRNQPISMTGEEFRHVGYQLVDTVANLLDHIGSLPVAHPLQPRDIRKQLPSSLPEEGLDANDILGRAAKILVENSTFTWHPRFWGYVNGSVAPLGVLADMLASAINPNVGGWTLSPAATEIEKQAVSWIAEMLGYDPKCGGIMVSGGNMANMVCFIAAQKASGGQIVYASVETHTWIQKAAALFGVGLDNVRWISVDDSMRMNVDDLRRRVREDRDAGLKPLCIVATAGTVATGAIDPISAIAEFCKAEGIWLHVDGAYGAPAALLSDAPADMKAIALADSIAVDPHKWFYAPFEAGCSLVRNPQHLVDAFSYRPSYYHFEGSDDDPRTSFYELGMQNTRGFRALKVWLLIQHAGRSGYEQMIRDDIELSKRMYAAVDVHPDFEAVTQGLSIATFRYVPVELGSRVGEPVIEKYLNDLNEAILSHLQEGGQLFVSNAVINEKYLLRACITNWRTTEADVDAVPDIVAAIGERLHKHMRRQVLL